MVPRTCPSMPSADSAAFERHFDHPRPELMPFVRRFTYVSAQSPVAITRVVPARADLFLQVIIAGGHTVKVLATGTQFDAPRATLVGPYTHPLIEITFQGRLELLLVQLQPTALKAFPGISVCRLTNSFAEAETAMGMDASQVIADFLAATTDVERLSAAEAFALGIFDIANLPDEIGHAARRLRDRPGRLSVEALAHIAGLSHRQFQRRFTSEVGIAPKTYARLCRMTAVIDARENQPHQHWADLAAKFGYADQAHLTREFREMTQQTPNRFERYH